MRKDKEMTACPELMTYVVIVAPPCALVTVLSGTHFS
jgi:hypothetical protein